MTDRQFPIGRYKQPQDLSLTALSPYIDQIEALPGLMRKQAESLSEAELAQPYRPAGWTKRQVIHHVADSHLNSYCRFRWTLTEDKPIIKAYDEKAWAMLPDALSGDIELSLSLLEAIHRRWVLLLRSLGEEELQRTFRHPEDGFRYSLAQLITQYAWHGAHHLGHLKL